MHPETLLGLAYGLFLALASVGLDALARRRSGSGDAADTPWPQVAAARLERSVAALLLVLAAIVLCVAAVRNPGGGDVAAVTVGAGVLAGCAVRRRAVGPPGN